MDRRAAVSGVIAFPGAAAVGLWMVSLRVPSLLRRDDLTPLYLAVVALSLVALIAAAVWRWRAGDSWHTNGALLVNSLAQGFNCCCSLGPALVKPTPGSW